MYEIKKNLKIELQKYFKEKSDNIFNNVKVITVDDYQGEENEIILLSLVRNNDNNSLGFVKIQNRIIVSLSRAKFGLYIFGNKDMLKKIDDWYLILENLEKNNLIKDYIPIVCLNHKTETKIKNVDDWENYLDGLFFFKNF
jgi:helicase required for RNAi-mediated heterochromatin assembly 1